MTLKVQVQDRLDINVPTSREFTPEGFLRVPAHVARTGVQEYFASELGLDGDPSRVIRVYRPADEVFKDESLAKYDGIDITIEHPDNFVNSSNYKDLTCGIVRGQAVRDGEYVKCDLIIKDKEAIDRVLAGKDELSVGYEAIYAVDDSGEYDFIQRDIDPNHLAITDRARAGHKARIFDSKECTIMTKRKVTIDSVEIEIDEKVALYIDKLTKDKDEVEAQRDNDRAEVERLKAEREKESKRLKELEDEKTENEAKKASEDAKRLTGDSVEGTTALEIKRKALDSLKFGTEGKSDGYVEALFDMQLAQRATVDSQHKQLGADGAQAPEPKVDPIAQMDESRSKFIDSLTNKGGK